MPLTYCEDSLILKIRLSPNASANKLGKIIENAHGEKQLKISTTATPEKGKANKALITFIAKTFKINKTEIEIIAGTKSRDKTCRINGHPIMLTDYIKRNSQTID